MTPQDVFSLFNKYPESSEEITEIFSDFMGVSMKVADLHEIHYSVLLSYQDPEDRTCKICGNIYDTEISKKCGFERVEIADCVNDSCLMVRNYFNIRNYFVYPSAVAIAGVKDKYRIANWYRVTLEKTFGVKQIHRIPLEKRLEVLLAMMLMRKAMDKEHEIIEVIAA